VCSLITTVTLNPAVDHFVIADNFTMGALNRVRNLERYPGGTGVKVSLMLGAMGTESIAAGFIGSAAGRFFKEKLHPMGVTTNFTYINGITRHNYFIIDEKSGTRTILDEEGPNVEPEELECFMDNFRRILYRSRIIIIAGSLPVGIQAKTYCDLTKLAKKSGVKTLMNSGEENLQECLGAEPYLILPDLRTSDEIMGISIDSDENRNRIACSLLGKGINIGVIAFNGGSYLISAANKCYKVNLPDIEIKSRRSGAAMLAGMAYEFAREGSLEAAIRMGAAASAASSQVISGFFGSIDDVRQYLDKIEIREVPL